ncbi:MAG: hypothetical protein Q7S87_17285 [Agitococcus sp.]|nr:hypothetical protein [Agitococcus sp.]
MTSLWPSDFEEDTTPAPKDFLQEQGQELFKITKGKVYADAIVFVKSNSNLLSLASPIYTKSFSYDYCIIGKLLDYKFKVFSFGHSILIYPMIIKLDEGIFNEINAGEIYTVENNHLIIESNDIFNDFVSKVFNSDKVKNVVQSIIKLSKVRT